MILQTLLTTYNNKKEDIIFSYTGMTKIESLDKFNNFIDSLTSIKRDWFTLSYGTHLAGFYINFHLDYIDDVDLNEINTIKHKLKEICSDDKIDLDYIDLIPDSSILLSTIDNISGEAEFDTISQLLTNNDINFKTNIREINRVEGGAGHWYENFSIFVISSISSGITYDIIKSTLKTLPIDLFKELSYFIFDKFKFKMLRNELANRIGCNPRYLLLKYIEKKRFFDIYIFVYNSKEVKVKVSRFNIIKKSEID